MTCDKLVGLLSKSVGGLFGVPEVPGKSNDDGAEKSNVGGGFIDLLGAADSTGCLGALSKHGLCKGPRGINSHSMSESKSSIIANCYVGNSYDRYDLVCAYHTTSHTNGNENHTLGKEVAVELGSAVAEGPTRLQWLLTMMTEGQLIDAGYKLEALIDCSVS